MQLLPPHQIHYTDETSVRGLHQGIHQGAGVFPNVDVGSRELAWTIYYAFRLLKRAENGDRSITAEAQKSCAYQQQYVCIPK